MANDAVAGPFFGLALSGNIGGYPISRGPYTSSLTSRPGWRQQVGDEAAAQSPPPS
jgi:hypothetical protein